MTDQAPDEPERLGSMLKRLRNLKGLNQTEAADALTVSQQRLSQWESGQLPSPEHLGALARLYDRPSKELLEAVYGPLDPETQARLDGLDSRVKWLEDWAGKPAD